MPYSYTLAQICWKAVMRTLNQGSEDWNKRTHMANCSLKTDFILGWVIYNANNWKWNEPGCMWIFMLERRLLNLFGALGFVLSWAGHDINKPSSFSCMNSEAKFYKNSHCKTWALTQIFSVVQEHQKVSYYKMLDTENSLRQHLFRKYPLNICKVSRYWAVHIASQPSPRSAMLILSPHVLEHFTGFWSPSRDPAPIHLTAEPDGFY